jgi:hypothetical protein
MAGTRHAQVPPSIIAARDISHGAFRTYCALALFANKHTGECHPKLATICEALGGADRSNVQKWIRELEEHDLVERHHWIRDEGGYGPDTYVLPFHPEPRKGGLRGAVESTAPHGVESTAPAGWNPPPPTTDQRDTPSRDTASREQEASRDPARRELFFRDRYVHAELSR